MKPLWVIQENLNDDDKDLLPIFEKLDIPYKLIKIIPFSDSIPDVDWDGPIIARGSTTTLKNTEKKNWKPGVWHNANFKPSVYQKNYGNHFLNRNGQVVLLGESDKLWKNEYYFVRPNSDYKEFTGCVKTKREIKKLIRGTKLKFYPFDENLELFVAEAIKIPNEYRFVVVNTKVISGAQYRNNFRLKSSPAPDRITKFAEKMTAIWNPADVYCLDIGVTKDDRIGVIECNCFNASGIYGDDAETIVKEVTNYLTLNAGGSITTNG